MKLLIAKEIIKYIEIYKNESKESIDLWYQKDSLNRHYFIEFLIFQKDFLKNVKDHKKRRNLINRTIDSCLYRGYFTKQELVSHATSLETNLILHITGKEFIEPLHFLNTVLKKYGFIITVVLSGIFWAFIFFIGDKIYWLLEYFFNKFI